MLSIIVVNDTTDEPERSIIRQQFDPAETTPETAIVETVADLKDADPQTLSPLYSTVDDILANVFDNPPAPEAQVQITVTYEGYRITLSQDGAAEFVKVT